MSVETANPPLPTATAGPTKLRLWPGIVLLATLWIARIVASMGDFAPFKFFFGLMIIPMAVFAGLVLWWLLFSRLRWADRLLVVGMLALASVGTILVAGENFPVMGMILYALPVLASLWVGWLVLSIPVRWPIRRAGVLVIFVATAVVLALLRVDGMDGSFAAAFSWRWQATPEQQLLLALDTAGTKADTRVAVEDLVEKPGDWTGFRGVHRDSRLTGVRINSDWTQSPPKEVWRHRIGPGWSSFAVVGKNVFTQEQRGENEYVVCYDAGDGKEIWSHRDSARFTELVAGAGPRATPSFSNGKLFTLGATGKLNCLSAANGKVIWTRDIALDAGAKTPIWGFSSSPLVAQGIVTVFAGGDGGKSVLGYQADTGDLAWSAGEGSLSYCSPQLTNICGVDQVLISTDKGTTSFEPVSGKVLWHHPWPVDGLPRITQPALVGDKDLLIGSGMGNGTKRIQVSLKDNVWEVKEQWTTRDISPYYNDFVVYGDYLYGFQGNLFTCVSLKNGVKKWKERGYGNGQVLLVADQGILLILSEQGDVALVAAVPDEHKELCTFKAIEGKTWNHPVIANGMLYVRNGQEIACFQLPIAAPVTQAAADRADTRQP